jgi:hypothetical protein
VKYFLLLLITGCLLSDAPAQFIFTPRKPIQTRTESIDKYESTKQKDSLPFSAILVIDSRYDTTNIGFYINGYLTLKDVSQPVALQHVIDKYYHHLLTPGKDTLLIQLEHLYIQDEVIRDTNFILTAGYASCNKYIGKNNTYKYSGSFDTVLQETFSYSNTLNAHKNGKHFNMEFWDNYLLRLDEAMMQAALHPQNNELPDTTKYRTISEIRQSGLLKRNKPILLADTPHHGFYRSFSEFVNNEPALVYQNADRLKKLLEVMHYRVGKHISNEAPDTSYWGYCDGRNIFIRYNYDFYQLERKDGNFYIAPTLDAKRREINRFGWNMLIGLATLSAGIATKEGANFSGFSALPPPNIPTIALQWGNAHVLGLRLDWETGKIQY